MKHLRYIFVAVFLQLFMVSAAHADEGMWLPLYINKIIGNMQGSGCKLSADQIYNMNQAAIKDGIVHFGGFCTGEIVSDKSLIFTNHHCGFDAIAGLSKVGQNYLDEGYWAMTDKDELPVPGLTASILVYMQDVSARVNNAADKDAEIKKIISEATAGNHYTAKVASMFYGNEYYLMVHEVFKDIRFVGAPPSSIGKFGGDTDNWMWPRHTGDFSVFRIYAGADNKPADYNVNNQPYKPKYFFPVNTGGLKPNDFVMIMGYPGRTTRYLTESSVQSLTQVDYPVRAEILKSRLEKWHTEMVKEESTRLTLASDYARFANSQKYYEGVMNAIKGSVCLTRKKLLEEGFTKWVNNDALRKSQYGTVLEDIRLLEENNKETIRFAQYLNFGYGGVQTAAFGRSFLKLYTLLGSKTPDQAAITTEMNTLKTAYPHFFEDFIKKADQEVFASVLRTVTTDLDKKYWVKTLTSKTFGSVKVKGATGDMYDTYASYTYTNTMLADSNKLKSFFENPAKKTMDADPGLMYAFDVMALRDSNKATLDNVINTRNKLMKVYIQGLREYQSDKFMYPDANSTLRITYGQVKSYQPKDGMMYNWYTTHKGILEKEIPGDAEFDVPKSLKILLENEDFGKYANEEGELPIAFLSNLDITGGNSGSPVINAKGELVGIAFDGVWEGMAGDIYFNEQFNRTISVDIRYVLFIIEKMGGATRIMNELKIVR